MSEVAVAHEEGVPIEAVCLYPVIDCPGWENDRMRPVGLLSALDETGRRAPYGPLARELTVQQARFEKDEPRSGVVHAPYSIGSHPASRSAGQSPSA
jgi:hypothetical protein